MNLRDGWKLFSPPLGRPPRGDQGGTLAPPHPSPSPDLSSSPPPGRAAGQSPVGVGGGGISSPTARWIWRGRIAAVVGDALEAGRACAGLGAMTVSPSVCGSPLGARGGGPRQAVAGAGLSAALRRVQAAAVPVRGRRLRL